MTTDSEMVPASNPVPKTRRKKARFIDLPLPNKEKFPIKKLAATLAEQAMKEIREEQYATTTNVLKLVGAGLLLGASVVTPGLGRLAPKMADWFKDEDDFVDRRRFNIPYLKRTLERLERQKLVFLQEKDGKQIIEITNAGKRKILKFALEELKIERPQKWNGSWWLVSYDIPKDLQSVARYFRSYLIAWGFYPFQESVFLHAFPCQEQVEFLREYLGIGAHVRVLKVEKIENDSYFRNYFDV